MSKTSLGVCTVAVLLAGSVIASAVADDGAFRDAQELYRNGQYFKSARYSFTAAETNASLKPEAYSWITLSLTRAGLYNSASYFFVKTLQTNNKAAIRRVLGQTEPLLVRVGGDLLRKYLIRHTGYEDYDSVNRSAYLYSLGKDTLLEGHADKAAGYFNGMSASSPLWPFALQLRATSYAMTGHLDEASRDFRACVKQAEDYVSNTADSGQSDPLRRDQQRREADDLRSRCLAGEARVLYERGDFQEADRAYDRIPKSSFVWPDILFEQAWNAFGKQEYNRTLGKLVSYKSPALSFVFNTEVDVLRAQAFLALCLYSDANDVINEFNGKYMRIGEEVKRFVESNAGNLTAFYDKGAEALRAPLSSRNDFHRLLNRSVRGPYFQNLVAAERAVMAEREAIRRFDVMQPGVSHGSGTGFPGFLDQVLAWRLRTIRMLGGAFIKNSLLDHHAILISDFEKMAFIKLEMLSRAKDQLLNRTSSGADRSRGNIEPSRRDDQYFWSFNGEFWNDELGDYVFGLESQCK